MVPAACAMRSLLGLKLFGNARHSHVMSSVLDEGLALFAGLNVIPKRSFLTEYSCRIEPTCYPTLMRRWFDTVSRLGLRWGTSFDLDFHTIPFHGEDALVEKHYVSKRSRQQKGILAFLAQDADTRVFCYANGELRKDQQNDEILRFVDFWKQRTGHLPEELIFDSKLTTYANLNELNRMGIQFITLRRRSKKLLDEIARAPASAWRRIELESVSRVYKTPRVLDRQITLNDYDRPAPSIDHRRLGARGTDPASDQPVEPIRIPPHRPLRPADADREQHRGRDRLLPHGCSVLGGGDEGQLRPAIDADGQQPVSPAGGSHRQWLRGRQVPPSVPRFHRRLGGHHDHRGRDRGPVPEAGPQPVADRRRVRQDGIVVPWLGGKRLRLVFG